MVMSPRDRDKLAAERRRFEADHDPNARDCVCCAQEVSLRGAQVTYRGERVCSWTCLAHRVTGVEHR
jgi:hypothetical protein